jgi:ribosome-binding protein aMBF1 (putative translation factor)
MGNYVKLNPELERKIKHLVGENIRKARWAKGWSVTELSRQTGIHRNGIMRIESGDNMPSLTCVMLLADALDVTLDEICLL